MGACDWPPFGMIPCRTSPGGGCLDGMVRSRNRRQQYRDSVTYSPIIRLDQPSLMPPTRTGSPAQQRDFRCEGIVPDVLRRLFDGVGDVDPGLLGWAG